MGIGHGGCFVNVTQCQEHHTVSGKEQEHPGIRKQGRDNAAKYEEYRTEIEETENPHIGCLGYGRCGCEAGESSKQKGSKCRGKYKVEHTVGMESRRCNTQMHNAFEREHENEHCYDGIDESKQKKGLVRL